MKKALKGPIITAFRNPQSFAKPWVSPAPSGIRAAGRVRHLQTSGVSPICRNGGRQYYPISIRARGSGNKLGRDPLPCGLKSTARLPTTAAQGKPHAPPPLLSIKKSSRNHFSRSRKIKRNSPLANSNRLSNL